MKPQAVIKALAAIVVWGASFVATKVAVREVSPLTVIVLRFVLGLGVLVLAVIARREFALPQRRDLGWLIFLGLNGITIHQLLQANGLVTASAINSGWIVALIPVFSALLAWLVLHEPFGRLKTLGLMLATMGAVLVISRGQLDGGLLRVPVTPGDLLMLLSAPNWALFTVFSKRLMSRVPATLMVTYVMAFGWLVTLPLWAGAAGWLDLPHLTLAGWASVIFLGLFCSGVAYVFWYDALAEAGASQVAAFLYLEPLVTLVVAAWLLGEAVTWATLLGGAIILIGVWLVNQREIPHAGRQAASAEPGCEI